MTGPAILAWRYRWQWAAICALAIGQGAALVAAVSGTRLAFASLNDGHLAPLALGLIAGASLGLAVLRPLLRLSAEALGQTFTAEVRRALFSNAMATSPAAIARRRRGYLMLRLTGDMAVLKDGLARSIPPLVQAATLLPVALAVLWLIDPWFGGGVAALVALALGVALYAVGPIRLAHVALRKQRARLAADMAERLPLAPDLARLGRRGKELVRLGRTVRAVRKRAQARLIRVEALRGLPGALCGLAGALLLWDGARRGLPAGDIAAALAALGLMAQTLMDLSGAIDRLTGWRVARGKLADALAVPALPPDQAGTPPGRIAGRKARFALSALPGRTSPHQLCLWPGQRGVLATPQPGHLLNVVLRHAVDDQITVTLDDIAVSRLSAGTIRRCLGVVGQDPVVLKGSLRRALCLGLPDRPPDQTLIRRIGRAGLLGALHQFGGLEAPLSEGARSLTPMDRIRLSALQTAVQRQGILLVAADTGSMPPDVVAYLAATPATVLRIGLAGGADQGVPGSGPA